jgi:hypothetical protein
MECPKCGEEVEPVLLEEKTLKNRYKCPNCNVSFSKKNLLGKALKIAGRIGLGIIIGDVVGDIGDIGTDADL